MQTIDKYSLEKTRDFPVDFPIEVAQEFERHFTDFIQRFLKDPKGPYGKVVAYYGRKEYQKRGK